METRLETVELKISYLEKHLDEMNDLITSQQRQIDMLELLVQRQSAMLRDMQPSDIKPQSEETPPPHY